MLMSQTGQTETRLETSAFSAPYKCYYLLTYLFTTEVAMKRMFILLLATFTSVQLLWTINIIGPKAKI